MKLPDLTELALTKSAGVAASKFADNRRDFGRSRFVGGDAISRNRLAADGVAAPDEVGTVRYGGRDLTARNARDGP